MKAVSRYAVIAASMGLCIAGACSETKTDPAEEKAKELYKNSVDLTRNYIDSISAATDSVALLGMNERFDEAMTELNYRYSPNVALKITEGENDTLVNLTDRYVAVRDSLLYRFAHPLVSRDSLASDSI